MQNELLRSSLLDCLRGLSEKNLLSKALTGRATPYPLGGRHGCNAGAIVIVSYTVLSNPRLGRISILLQPLNPPQKQINYETPKIAHSTIA